MPADDFLAAYQWNLRPRNPARPEEFREWPGGARMALYVIVLHEWESVPFHRSRPMPANAHHKFDFLALGGREYGARSGVWRLLDVLDKHGVKATMVASGLVAEVFPESLRAACGRGHEIAAHQWDQAVFPFMFQSREEERASLVKTRQALEQASGARIVGYMSPGPRPTPHTLELIAELDLRWTADYVDADIPYVISVNGKRIVSVGYAVPGFIDAELMPLGAARALEEMKFAFDAVYEESKRQPMKFCYAVHTHWGGSAGMARMLDEFLAHARARPGVWLARCVDLAEFWARLPQPRSSSTD
jgi:peptidoglycan/xylan/chitin deacetylase (PgdA/CDA1 family)